MCATCPEEQDRPAAACSPPVSWKQNRAQAAPRAVQGVETAVRGSSFSQDPFILGFIVSSHSGPGRLPAGF